MPDDVGGQPSQDGEEPEYRRHHGEADDAFASVVFDEDFVRAADVHEPTAAERILAAAQHPAESHGRSTSAEGEFDEEDAEDGRFDYTQHGPYGPAWYPGHSPFGPYGAEHGPVYHSGDAYEHGADFGYLYAGADEDDERPYRSHTRWQRPVAWVLAVVMGLGVVALAFSAVYRGAAAQRTEPSPPPATTGVDDAQQQSEVGSSGALPSVSTEDPDG